MNTSRLVLAAALTAFAAFGAQADEADSSQYAAQVTSTKTRAQVQAEFLASRATVAAMTREDSGAAYLATRTPTGAATKFAGRTK
jgi:hypothetical protein